MKPVRLFTTDSHVSTLVLEYMDKRKVSIDDILQHELVQQYDREGKDEHGFVSSPAYLDIRGLLEMNLYEDPEGSIQLLPQILDIPQPEWQHAMRKDQDLAVMQEVDNMTQDFIDYMRQVHVPCVWIQHEYLVPSSFEPVQEHFGVSAFTHVSLPEDIAAQSWQEMQDWAAFNIADGIDQRPGTEQIFGKIKYAILMNAWDEDNNIQTQVYTTDGKPVPNANVKLVSYAETMDAEENYGYVLRPWVV